MTEVELKARVSDREKLIKTLDSFAKRKEEVIKEDRYFKNGQHLPPLRLRTENYLKSSKTKRLLTYKHKKMLSGKDGTPTEVNEELESEVENFSAIEQFLTDYGFTLSVKKRKEVLAWTFQLKDDVLTSECKEVLFELCKVHPLGDFLEIEVLVPNNDKALTQKAQSLLLELLARAGLSASDLESKSYSQMLKETCYNPQF